MAKPQTPEQKAAAQAAKDAAKAKRADHAQKLDKPDPALEAAAKEETEAKTAAELAAKGLKDGGSLSDGEVQKVAGRALGMDDEEDGVILALTARLEVCENRIKALEDENEAMHNRMRKLRTGDADKGAGLHGSIDKLRT